MQVELLYNGMTLRITVPSLSSEYHVTLNSTSTDELTYSTSNTTLHIKSSDLLKNVTYTYTVKGRPEEQSIISKPFTLGRVSY